MSRIATPSHSPPTASVSTVKVPHEKIAMCAFEKWCKRGRPHGNDKQDWLEAERELHAEMNAQSGTHSPGHRR